MTDFHAIASFALVYVCGVVIPGPNFVAVTHKAVTSSTAHGLAMVAGIVGVNLFWATSAILGVAAVFAVFPWLALAVKLMGAAYLVWFGVRLMVSGARPLASEEGGDASATLGASFRQGVVVNIVNPKSIAFYAAVISAAAPRHVTAGTLAGMLACVAVIATLWYGAVAVLFSRPAVTRWFRRHVAAFNRVCGLTLVGLGIRNALTTGH